MQPLIVVFASGHDVVQACKEGSMQAMQWQQCISCFWFFFGMFKLNTRKNCDRFSDFHHWRNADGKTSLPRSKSNCTATWLSAIEFKCCAIKPHIKQYDLSYFIVFPFIFLHKSKNVVTWTKQWLSAGRWSLGKEVRILYSKVLLHLKIKILEMKSVSPVVPNHGCASNIIIVNL